MKAISLTQPWASLVIDGRKHIETRSWPTSFRGVVAIHAAKSIDKTACKKFGYDPEKIARGAVLGTAVLSGCFQFAEITRNIITPEEESYGDFSPGRFGFDLICVTKFEWPVPARGSLGLWNWNEESK